MITNTPTQAYWKLQVFDQSGDTIATGTHSPNNGPPTITGDMIALAEAMPSVKSLDRFFVDPDEQGRECYTAYAIALEEAYGTTLPTWDQLKADPRNASSVEVWRKTAAAAARIDHNLN